jgi:ATP-dependent Clp protease ATP-binding subunit ClpB
MDASNLLKPALARGELHCIGATTLDEYRKHVEKDAALERRFQPVMVGEPTVPDTISILRGLKEKYELHHGVRITDAALVAAATLSHRYITDRFLPDKAIDLIDEAASRLRMEVESKPEEIENLDRRIMQLKIEREALRKESDSASKDRLGTLEGELANLEQQSLELTGRWQADKDKIGAEAELKGQIDAARIELEQAQRGGDLARAGELRVGLVVRAADVSLTHVHAPCGAASGALDVVELRVDVVAGVGAAVRILLRHESHELVRDLICERVADQRQVGVRLERPEDVLEDGVAVGEIGEAGIAFEKRTHDAIGGVRIIEAGERGNLRRREPRPGLRQ